MKGIVWLFLGCVLGSVAFAQENSPLEKNLEGIYVKAESAIDQANREKADFWMARYMGLTTFNKNTERYYTDLFPLYQKRKDLTNFSSFISGKYTDEFLDFFITGTHHFWGIPDQGVQEELSEFSIRGESDGRYFAQLVISPKLVAWTVIGREFGTAVIPLVSSDKPPYLVSGRVENNVPFDYFTSVKLDTGGQELHYIWPIEFHDLNEDQTPEIWIRYNRTSGDGFSQILDIYQIQNDEEVVLLKRFEGASEGIARRTRDGHIEVGQGMGEAGALHMNYDRHRIETFEYQDGDFVKVSQTDVPHILWDDSWKKYYFNAEEESTETDQ